MSDQKRLWNDQRTERENMRKEFLKTVKSMTNKFRKDERDIETEAQRQIETELSFNRIALQNQMKEQLELCKAKEREVEEKSRQAFEASVMQARLERNRIQDEIQVRTDQIISEFEAKQRATVERNRLNAKHKTTDLSTAFDRELDGLIESMNRQFIELEEKLKARERDQMDSESIRSQPKQTEPTVSAVSTDSVKRKTEVSPASSSKASSKVPTTKTTEKKAENKDKDTKKEAKKDTKKDQKKDKDKPWRDMNQFNG